MAILEANALAGARTSALDARPTVDPWAEPYWRAFLDLARERHPPLAPIPLSAVRAWLDEEQIDDPAERAAFREIVARLDGQWLERARRASGEERP
ncbi:MAG: hypothetical protein AB7O45_11135 [Alphaproteobacteria bacterium]